MRSRFAIGSSLVIATAIACGPEPELRQGEPYAPDGTLPIASASPRPDRARCDGSTCDGGGVDAAPLQLLDGLTEPFNTCETARLLGTFSGDTGAGSVTGKGACSEWLSFRATEDDSSALGVGMKVKLTLTPVGADFELYAFLDKDRDRLACSAPTGRSFQPGTTVEEISLEWGEGTVANGSDDGRTIGVVVVRSGACSSDAGSYTLLAQRNP